MKTLLLFISVVFLLYGSALVPDSLVAKVDAKYGRFAKARFEALQHKLAGLQGATTEEKLKGVNNFFNRVPYGSDKKVFGISDYWATPYEFLARDKGDCEDYAIAKYFALLELGIDSSKLYLTYVRVKGYKQAHMVLSYYETKSSMPLVLDSLNKRVLPAAKRTDLKPIYNLNPNILKDGKKTKAHRKWDDLIKRMKEKKL